jgi:hypothetical protein
MTSTVTPPSDTDTSNRSLPDAQLGGFVDALVPRAPFFKVRRETGQLSERNAVVPYGT